MLHGFYKWLSPRSLIDLAVKIALVCGIIILLNFAFNRYYIDAPNLTLEYLVVNSIVVGGPFVLLFFFVLTKQIGLQKSLVELARFDHLTNIPNRRYFLKQAEAAILTDDFSVLLLLDVDHFKSVNDTWGHAVGDECLKSLSHILARTVRSDDIVGRLGGEEFGILLRNTRLDMIGYISTHLLKPFPFNAKGDLNHLTVTVSIGACEIAKGGDLEAALVTADQALYKAKDRGRCRLERAA